MAFFNKNVIKNAPQKYYTLSINVLYQSKQYEINTKTSIKTYNKDYKDSMMIFNRIIYDTITRNYLIIFKYFYKL